MLIIDGFRFDVIVSEDHQFTSEISSNPIESGADVTDNVRNLPVSVSINAIASEALTDPTVVGQNGPNYVQEAFNKLRDVHTRRLPITIVTALQQYESMAMETLSIPLSAQTGKALEFSCTFQRIDIVDSDREVVQVDRPAAAKQQRKGFKESSERDPTPEEDTNNASVLYRLWGFGD